MQGSLPGDLWVIDVLVLGRQTVFHIGGDRATVGEITPPPFYFPPHTIMVLGNANWILRSLGLGALVPEYRRKWVSIYEEVALSDIDSLPPPKIFKPKNNLPVLDS